MRLSPWLPQGVPIVLFVAAVLLPQTQAHAQPLSSVSAAFADVGVGARVAAMGYAGVASGEGLSAAVWNPASAAGFGRVEASFVYLDQFGLLSYAEAALGVSLGKKWGIGVVARDSGDDALRETSVRAIMGHQRGGFSIGGSMSLLLARFGRNNLSLEDYSVFDPSEIAAGTGNQIQGEATGFSADLGVKYARGRAAIGVVARNLLAPVRWDSRTASGSVEKSYTEGIPMEVVIGSAIPLGSNALFVMDYRPAIGDLKNTVRAGAEWTLADMLAIRAGTERSFNGQDDERYTVGFGISPPFRGRTRIRAGYSFATGILGNSQQFSMLVIVR
jgi:hypothetical protein